MDQVIEISLENTIQDLRSRLQGRAFLMGEDGVREAIASWNLLVDHRPAIVVSAETEADVEAAVLYANKLDLPIGIQATGHGPFRTLNGGMLINVSGLNHVELDLDTKTARVGGGAQWHAVIEAAAPHNLFPISGSAPHVGVVGYTIGGGYGILSRKYGLGVDQVISLRIVDPQGQIRTTSATENSDLYWAVLGGGGSFGVITEITLQLHQHLPMFGGSVMFDSSLAADVYPAFLEFTKQTTEDVSSALTMINFPPIPAIPSFLHGRSMLVFSAAALGEDSEPLLAPIRNLPGAEYDSFRSMKYSESAAVYQDPVDPLPATMRGVLLKDMDQETLAQVLAAVGEPAQSPNLLFRIRHLGGAMSRAGAHANSVGRNRAANYLVYFIGVPMGPNTVEDMHAHADKVIDALAPHILSRGPLNWLGAGNVSGAAVAGTFDASELNRQREIKKSIDPENRFRFAGVGLD